MEQDEEVEGQEKKGCLNSLFSLALLQSLSVPWLHCATDKLLVFNNNGPASFLIRPIKPVKTFPGPIFSNSIAPFFIK
jgi:hypothetical protein